MKKKTKKTTDKLQLIDNVKNIATLMRKGTYLPHSID